MAHSNPHEQASITDFDAESTPTTSTATETDNDQSPADDPLANVDLPDQTEWTDEPVDCGCSRDNCHARFVRATGRFSFDGGTNGFLRDGEMAVLTSDVDAYIDTHVDRELNVPTAYNRFSEQFTPYVGYVSATSGGYGYGISPSRLEGAVRLASGGGRFSSDDLAVYGLGKLGALACYRDRAVIVASVQVGKPDGTDAPTTDVRGMAVEEQDQTLISGIDELVPLVERKTDLEVVAHEQCRRGKHYFTTGGGETVRVGAHHLKRIAGGTADADEVLGEHSYEDPWGESFRFSIGRDDLEYEVGDQRQVGGTIVAMRALWEDPRRSSRVSLSGRVSLRVGYLTLSLSELSSGGYRVEVNEATRTVAKRRPEGRSYKPMADHRR